jgi:cyclophilin family peptidyl-prolyl cis-trans isomerase
MLGITIVVIVCIILYLFIKKNSFNFFNNIFSKLKKVDPEKQEKDIDQISDQISNEVVKNTNDDDIDDDIASIFNDQKDDKTDDEDIENIFGDSTPDPKDVIVGHKEHVYLDISVDNSVTRVIIELRGDVVPKTCKNFIELCKDKKYKGTKFFRILKDFMIQGGDFINNNGTGRTSIYGTTFKDENFVLKHERGVISMANSGPDTNGCQFFITTAPQPHLDDKHVVFGKVIKGMDGVDYISNLEVDKEGKTFQDVVVTDCGILN